MSVGSPTAFCTQCGHGLASDVRFCTACGASVQHDDDRRSQGGEQRPEDLVDETGGEGPASPSAVGWARTEPDDDTPVMTWGRVPPIDPRDVGPRVGGWGVLIFFFGFLGGAIGWLALKEKDQRRADHVLKWGLIWTVCSILIWVLVSLLFVAIVAHSVSSSASSFSAFTDPVTTTPTFYATTTTPTTTTGPSIALGHPVLERTVSGETTDGYSATADVTVYRPFHADRLPSLPLSGRSTIASCAVDGSRDAAIPISIVLTNTTLNFSTVLQFNLSASTGDYTDAGAVSIEGDLQFTDSSACDGPQTRDDADVYSVIWNTPTDPDQTVSGDFFLILHDYYSPNQPHGDATLLSSLQLVPVFDFGASGEQTAASADSNIPLA